MSNTRYLEFDSTYRNRNLWPLPSNFEIPIEQSGSKNRFSAEDPISHAAPILTFNGSFRDDIKSSISVSITVPLVSPPQINNANNPTVFIINSSPGFLRLEQNFYKHAVITLTNGTVTIRRVVESYDFITTNTTDIAKITVTSVVPDSIWLGLITGSIDNPSFLNPGNLIFIPFSPFIENLYVNCIIQNISTGTYAYILSYESSTGLATLSDNTTAGWDSGDTFLIRKELPSHTGNITGVTTSSILVLDALASSINDFYIGSFIRISNPPTAVAPSSFSAPQNEMRRIVSYNGTTKTISLNPPFSTSPAIADPFEILGFSADNFNPFSYNGSMVSQQESVCYEIELIDLVLPNGTLSSGKGGRIAFYPYVYVELQNTSGSSAGTKNIIYSNNPNSTRMLFRAPIDDISNPLNSPFIKIDSDGATQTIKFKINDNLRVAIYLPNGELFKLVTHDTISPVVPNELIQISGCFEIKRVM